MTEKYLEWVKAQNLGNGGYGKCAEITHAMVIAFPELEPRKGIFHSMFWGDRTHWWCRHSETHQIIDPTALQHPDGQILGNPSRYTDLTEISEQEAMENELIPIGKCPNCGEYIWYGSKYVSFCSEQCSKEYDAYLRGML